jgi:hypothetical protein
MTTMLALAALLVNPAYATAIMYGFHVNTGTTVTTGISSIEASQLFGGHNV